VKPQKIKIPDIFDIHKGIPAVICGHGPSLNDDKLKIEEHQKDKKLIRFSVNNWYDYFSIAPNYWVISNSMFSIPVMHKIMNHHGSPIFYSKDGDDSTDEYINKTLRCDYLQYDQRHFKGHNCLTILKAFKSHHEKNNNFDFMGYGNNNIMWHPPRISYPEGWAGFDLYGRCCEQIDKEDVTLQEHLQQETRYDKHYSTGDTVALHAIAFAILMGCNPIYLSGVDLSYKLGYANVDQPVHGDHYTLWEDNQKNLLSDLKILLDSASNKGIQILNLNKNSWFDIYPHEHLI